MRTGGAVATARLRCFLDFACEMPIPSLVRIGGVSPKAERLGGLNLLSVPLLLSVFVGWVVLVPLLLPLEPVAVSAPVSPKERPP